MGVWDEQMQTIMHRVDYNRILLYSKGNYIQHPIKHKGKEYEKEYTHTHTYILLNQFARN